MFLLSKLTQSSQFFVSEVEMVSKCLSHQAPGCVLVSAVPGPACSSLQHCSTRPPNCSCVQRCSQGGDRAPQSLSPQLTKMCHFIIISGCQQCSLAPTLALCISAPEFGDLAHKNHPQPGPGSRSFAFTQRSSVAKTQTSLSLTRNSDECSRHFIALSKST